MNTKTFTVACLFFCLFTAVQAQQKEKLPFNHSEGWRIDFSGKFGVENFFNSDLSVCQSLLQQERKNTNSSFEFKYTFFGTKDNYKKDLAMFLGFDMSASHPIIFTDIALVTKENVSLRSLRAIAGFFFQPYDKISLEVVFACGWGGYYNEITAGNIKETYVKNGFAGGVGSSLYISPVRGVQIGGGIEYRLMQFKNNASLVGAFQSQMQKNREIQSIYPFVALRIVI